MQGNNLRKLVDRSLGAQVDTGAGHSMTVKLPEDAYAKLRALVDLVGRPKTPLASEILVAAIDDFVEALPNEPLDEATSDKLRGVIAKMGADPLAPYGMRDIVRERAEAYISHDDHQRWEKEDAAVSAAAPSSNGKVD
jgi:hypothetical protein